MKVKISMLLIVWVLFSGLLIAQTKVSVTGKVTGNDGLPLPGVSVVIKGTHVVFLLILMESIKSKLHTMK